MRNKTGWALRVGVRKTWVWVGYGPQAVSSYSCEPGRAPPVRLTSVRVRGGKALCLCGAWKQEEIVKCALANRSASAPFGTLLSVKTLNYPVRKNSPGASLALLLVHCSYSSPNKILLCRIRAIWSSFIPVPKVWCGNKCINAGND